MELFDISQPRGGRIYAEAKRWHGKAIRVYLFTTAYNASGAATVEAVLAELELTPYEERKGTGVIHTEHDSRVVDDAAAFADLVNDYIADQAVQATELWLQRYHGIPKLMTDQAHVVRGAQRLACAVRGRVELQVLPETGQLEKW